tara:strand:- start:107 stop:1093 length:987 start_codon:yes stop_codon:yes gene_type:complete
MKRLRPEDITLHTTTVHKSVKVQEDDSSLTIVNYNSSSNNTVSQSYYNSLNHLFYDNAYHNSASMGGFAGNYEVYDDYMYPNPNNQPQHRNKFFESGILLDISSSLYGERIRSGSLKISNRYHPGAGNTIWIVDDGIGNLYASGSRLVVSQSSDTHISSSENYIGNVFYEDGLIVITETGSFNGTQSWSGSLDSASIEFEAETSFITKQVYCKIKKTEYNMTTNQTILHSSSSSQSIDLPWYSYYAANGIPYPGGRKPAKREDYMTYEFTSMDDFVISKQFLHRDFSPYMSKIGLYNANRDLIMVATFPTPIKKSKYSDMTIVVQYDY